MPSARADCVGERPAAVDSDAHRLGGGHDAVVEHRMSVETTWQDPRKAGWRRGNKVLSRRNLKHVIVKHPAPTISPLSLSQQRLLHHTLSSPGCYLRAFRLCRTRRSYRVNVCSFEPHPGATLNVDRAPNTSVIAWSHVGIVPASALVCKHLFLDLDSETVARELFRIPRSSRNLYQSLHHPSHDPQWGMTSTAHTAPRCSLRRCWKSISRGGDLGGRQCLVQRLFHRMTLVQATQS